MSGRIKFFFFIGLGLIAALCLWDDYDRNRSGRAMSAKRNISNSKKLQIGMTKTEVIAVMGLPNDSVAREYDRVRVDVMLYFYATNDDSEPYIQVNFNERGRVSHIFLYHDE
ncbi:MAG: hypothetical protein JNM41_14525 [Flavipsychrobacter sp.]|nr:hypothetical protein [Flavipsychrobacter sp.]